MNEPDYTNTHDWQQCESGDYVCKRCGVSSLEFPIPMCQLPLELEKLEECVKILRGETKCC